MHGTGMFTSLLLAALFAVVKSETTLECLDDKMVVKFDSAQNVEAYSLKGSSGSCTPSKDATTIEIKLNECGTEANHNSSHIIYENTLTGSGTATSIINRGSMLVLVLKCSYERNGTTTVLEWKAGQAVIEIEGEGIFTFNMEVFDADETQLASPFEIELRETLIFKISLDVESALRLTLETEHVIAMDNSDIDATTNNKYFVVQDYCKKDSTYAVIGADTNVLMYQKFSIEAFNFISDATAPVYIHAVMKICNQDDADYNTCSAGCIPSSRRRRDATLSSKDRSREFNIYGGPFMFNDPETEEYNDPSDGYKSQVSAFTLVLGQAALLLFNN